MQSNKLDFSNQNVYVGFDVHLKDWKVSVMVDDIHHKTFSQPPSPEVLVNYLQKNFPSANYLSAYEAGFCGFWIHHELQKLGVKSMVVNPADIPTTGKESTQKEDQRDRLKIEAGSFFIASTFLNIPLIRCNREQAFYLLNCACLNYTLCPFKNSTNHDSYPYTSTIAHFLHA